MKTIARPPLVVGLAGGTASGKTWLAAHLAQTLGPSRCAVIPHDHYYRDHPELTAAQRRALDFDSPAAFETTLLLRHLRELRAGRAVAVPRYRFDISRRTTETDELAPAPIILVEGLFALADARLRRAFDLKIFVHTPADLRLLRRIRRDTTERRHPLAEVLERYETHARPGHERHVEPSRRHADLVWEQETDKAFPARLLARLRAHLSRHHADGRQGRGERSRADFGADRATEYSESISSRGPRRKVPRDRLDATRSSARCRPRKPPPA